MKDFMVFVATIRPLEQTHGTFARLLTTLHPTFQSDVFIARGIGGKHVTQNEAIRRMAADYRYWAAVDDDLLLPPGWQPAAVQAFRDVPNLGACGIELDMTCQQARDYMLEVPEPQVIGQTTIRLMTRVNVGGLCIITPTEFLRQVEPVPSIEGVEYTYYEDGWLCHQLRKLGKVVGYVRSPGGPARMLNYQDSQAYIDKKDHDREAARPHVAKMLK